MRFLTVCIALTIVVIALASHPLRALQVDGGTGVTLTYDIVTPLSAHEPVILYQVVRNDSDNRAFVDLGWNKMGNSHLTITAPEGMRIDVDDRISKTGGLSQGGQIYVSPHSTVENEILLSRWTDFGTAGDYEIRAAFSGRIEPPVGQSIHIERRWSGRVQITPRDQARLREICEALTRRIETTDNASQLLDSVARLAAVRDPVAVDYLDRAIKASRLVGDTAIGALERIGNERARQVLARVSTGPDIDHADAAKRALDRLDQLPPPAR